MEDNRRFSADATASPHGARCAARPQGASFCHGSRVQITFALSLVTLVIWIVLVFGRHGFWRVRLPEPCPAPPSWPAVVAIIPARNEADVLADTLASVLEQDYAGPFEVILVDDHSTDGTAAHAHQIAQGSPRAARLRVVAAKPLPMGWTGKVWAQAEGLAAASLMAPEPRYVWLTDADIWHPAGALTELVSRAQSEGRVLTSLMVRLRCVSWAERALIPAFVFFFAKLYPFAAVNDDQQKVAAAAGGCMLAARTSLAQIGGMAAIQDALIDDCALAQELKRVGPIRLDLASRSASRRRYDTWGSIWNMIARTAFTQLRYSSVLLSGTVLGLVLTYALPPFLSLTGGLRAWPALCAWVLMTCAYLPILRYYGRNPLWAPLLPLVALFYLGATLESARRYWTGQGGHWKGRAQAPRRP
jgi:hopene-associated glycosyltransferase HpnB